MEQSIDLKKLKKVIGEIDSIMNKNKLSGFELVMLENYLRTHDTTMIIKSYFEKERLK